MKRVGLISRHQLPNGRRRGQTLPLFALLLLPLLLVVALLVQVLLAYQAYRDLDTIAFHAARAGAAQIVRPCTAPAGSTCRLNTGRARTTARQWVQDWLSQSDQIWGVGSAYNNSTEVRFTDSNRDITVIIHRCYQLPLNLYLDATNCPLGGIYFIAGQRAHSLVGQ